MEEKQKLRNLVSQKIKITKEIEQIQKECSHSDKQIKFVSGDKGNITKPMWVCKLCDKVLNIPTQKETEDWIKK
tara:strand:+ start:1469 stop:1690 length:222 start_codon:yes stop_codon:yes gene_type:complete